MNNFGERLTDAMKSKNINDADLARITSLSPPTIKRYKTNMNSPTLDNIYKIADALEIEFDMLITGKIKSNIKIEQRLLDDFRKLNNENQIEILSEISKLLTKEELTCQIEKR